MPNDIVGRGIALDAILNEERTPDWQLTLTRTEQGEIEQAIFIILMTPIGQRVMRPRFGSRLHELVFAPNNLATAVRAQRYVKEALGMWEPRITVLDVLASPDEKNREQLQIFIEYKVNMTHNQRSLVFPFYLIPQE
ncbi:MAG TPA: GPW/gp25 family protein [Cyclobacteriaceae bacterium]|nr:GPW/gp25 family protein [Cyclobacteriaceae bacterium]